jgi:Tol biopolymer transport system component/tRNA A-37 threonylcarbamoyl transferase component Bud32
MTGTTVGRYELLEKLGEGGMGVVYRARDVNLNRLAALKFLPPHAELDSDRKRRFLQEAQAASALNHPNIVTIYEIGLAPPHEFIAMEYVQGTPLDALIGASGLPFRDVLAYSIQIADALAAAHAAGIVHRDVKPANVLISNSGVAKVLDFGLAKLAERASTAGDDVTHTVAIGSSSRTVEGTIMGTVSYMSPEQAEGKAVDHRSDIFSFGAMVYEMLTGKRAFVGDSAVSTLAAILRAEPADVTEQLPDVPKEFNRIVRRCLEKAPERRWQSMADVRAVVEDLKQDVQSGQLRAAILGEAAPATPRSFHSRWFLGIAGAIVVAAAGLVMLQPRETRTAASYVFRRLTSDAASNVAPAISPDGKLVAYSSDRAQSGTTDIWVQQVAGGEPVRLTSGLGLCHSPTFSPDGSRIAFQGGPDSRGVYLVSTFGGEARRIADGRGPMFSPDGTQISYMGPMADRIMVMPVVGGTPREVPVKHPVINRALWLPDGKRFLFLGADALPVSRTFDWYTIPVEGGEESSCDAAKWLHNPFNRAAPNAITSEGVVIFAGEADAANLYRIPFDVARRRVTGGPVPLTVAPGINFWPAASADGTKVVFGNASSFNTNLWAMNIDAATGTVTGEPRRVTGGLVDRTAPYPSPDGKRLAYKATSGRMQEIRVLELGTGQETRIAETADATPPVISDDGKQIAYGIREQDGVSIYSVAATGGVPRRLCKGCGRPVAWLARGTRILYDQAAKSTEIGILDVGSGNSNPILRAQGSRIYTPRLSPDGRILCFTRITNAAMRRTYAVRFSDDHVIPEDQWRTVTAGPEVDERQPVWSPNGRLLYFLSEKDGFRCVWAVRFDPASLKAEGGDSFPVHHLHQFRHSLLEFSDVADIGLSVSGTTMYLSVREIQSNIWLAERNVEAR